MIGEQGEHLGVLKLEDARRRAEEAGLDLVEVATGSVPHVCRIMDYGHYKFEQAKRQREAKKKQKTIVVKEIKMRPRTDQHDYQFKLSHARRFLEQGYKVKFTVLYRGRELAHKEHGRLKLQRVEADLVDLAVVETNPRFEGRTMHMVMAPSGKPKKKAAPSPASVPRPEAPAPTPTKEPEAVAEPE